MQSVISTYDSSSPSSLSATADACRKAYDDLGKSGSILSTNLGSKRVAEQRALSSAYRSARAGFLKCSTGGSSLNFPMLAAAEQDMASANRAIRRAQSLEH